MIPAQHKIIGKLKCRDHAETNVHPAPTSTEVAYHLATTTEPAGCHRESRCSHSDPTTTKQAPRERTKSGSPQKGPTHQEQDGTCRNRGRKKNSSHCTRRIKTTEMNIRVGALIPCQFWSEYPFHRV